jgi:hypothetical protein
MAVRLRPPRFTYVRALACACFASSIAAFCLFAPAAQAQSCIFLRYAFQPDCYRPAGSTTCVETVDRLDLGPQIAVWIESADRTRFVDTLMVTNLTAARGIGNRPGIWNFRSGPFFPYGKRAMVLPVWAHARGVLYDTVLMQDGREDWMGFHESHSSTEPYYCRPLMPNEVNVDAITCPTRFNSAKGRLVDTTKSYYPPRNDLTTFTNNDCDIVGDTMANNCTVSAEQYSTLNDLDAVAAATPAYGATYTGSWTIPTDLPAGDYALMVEVNKEFDQNPSYMQSSFTDPNLPGYGLDGNFGQPSVIYRVPIHIDPAAGPGASAAVTQMAGYGDPLGVNGDFDGDIRPPDATISTTDPGSGEMRLLEIPGSTGTAATGRVHVEIDPCTCDAPPSGVSSFVTEDTGVTATSATLQFQDAGVAGARVHAYEVRYREGTSMSDDEFAQSIAGPLVTPGDPGTLNSFTLSGLKPKTQYVVGIRALGACQDGSAISVLTFLTPSMGFKQVSGCFIATAAYGSALEPHVARLRELRDRLRPASALFAAAADLYYRSGPAAAAVLRRSDTARALARELLGPVAAAAQVTVAAGPQSRR